MRQTLKKAERLCSRKMIGELFDSGNSFVSRPFRIIWKETDFDRHSPAKMMPTVPVRYFRKAVTRNLIKRRIKEAYRKNKELLYPVLLEMNKSLLFIIQYTDRNVMDYRAISQGVEEVLKKLTVIMKKHAGC